METWFGGRIYTAIEKLAGWPHAGHWEKDFLSKCKVMLIKILQGTCYLFGLVQCDMLGTLWEMYACNIFRGYEAGGTARMLKDRISIQNYFDKLEIWPEKNGWKIKCYKKADISGDQIQTRKVGEDQFFRISFGVSVDYKLNINHVVGETSFMMGFIKRKAVCHAQVILVLWSGVVKPR